MHSEQFWEVLISSSFGNRDWSLQEWFLLCSLRSSYLKVVTVYLRFLACLARKHKFLSFPHLVLWIWLSEMKRSWKNPMARKVPGVRNSEWHTWLLVSWKFTKELPFALDSSNAGGLSFEWTIALFSCIWLTYTWCENSFCCGVMGVASARQRSSCRSGAILTHLKD